MKCNKWSIEWRHYFNKESFFQKEEIYKHYYFVETAFERCSKV